MDNIHNPPLLSVHILLPEAIDRRLKRRTQEMRGASWPSWGGHITLIPKFVPVVSVEEIQSLIAQVCAEESTFVLRFSEPVAVPDKTRAEYFALFLKVAESDGLGNGQETTQDSPLHRLRKRLLRGLDSLRQDRFPELVEQPFFPHVTLALGVSESEAQSLVRGLRADPFEASFLVEQITLISQGVGDSARVDRISIPLGRSHHDVVLLE